MKKNIVITGASGLVATELTHLLMTDTDEYVIYAVSTHPEKLRERYMEEKSVCCLDLDGLADMHNIKIDVVVHCAFARSKEPGELAKALQYTSALLRTVKGLRPSLFVNISSQGVYGQSNKPLWTEQTPPAPRYLYALAKFSTEEMTALALEQTSIRFTNIRLSSVCENARFMNIFAKNALSGTPIKVLGGSQQCSFVDVRDVASALKCVIDKAYKLTDLQPVYNLGSGLCRTILELAQDTKRIVESEMGKEVTIDLQPSDLRLEAGMNITLFCNTFGWHPEMGYDDMIRSLIALNSGSDNEWGG